MSAAIRSPMNVGLPESVVSEAETLDVNLSCASEAGLASAAKAECQRRWRAENREVMESWAGPLERHGLPLARFRAF